MEAKFTKGPWAWDGPVWEYGPKEEAPWLIAGPHGNPVIHGELLCNEADAKLIAAAPDLYEALDTLRDVIGLTAFSHEAQRKVLQDAVDVATAALKKARGEE